MTKFLLIRHALTDLTGSVLSGRSPGIGLNEQGRDQAQKLAAKIKRLPVAAIYSSPLQRAIETAEAISMALDLPVHLCEDFLEIDFGEWTNHPVKDLTTDPQFIRFNLFRSGTAIPGGESMLQAQLRMISGLHKLFVRHPSQSVVIVSHADMIKSAVAYFSGIPVDMLGRVEISPASLSIIEQYEDTARILLLNET
jgi:probable phosphoglycerate mutase